MVCNDTADDYDDANYDDDEDDDTNYDDYDDDDANYDVDDDMVWAGVMPPALP